MIGGVCADCSQSAGWIVAPQQRHRAIRGCGVAPAKFRHRRVVRNEAVSSSGGKDQISTRIDSTPSASGRPLSYPAYDYENAGLREDILWMDKKARGDTRLLIEGVQAIARRIALSEFTEDVALKAELERLKHDLDVAHRNIHTSESRVEHTLKRLRELEELLHCAGGVGPDATVVASTDRMDRSPDTVPQRPAQIPVTAGRSALSAKDGMRHGGVEKLALNANLKNFWFPAVFSKDLTKDLMVPFELFGETWVAFRDADGLAACLRDECAHRACPLSLGKMKDGEVMCAYHGWQFDRKGSCTKMPSCKPTSARVDTLPITEFDGFVWVWPGDGTPVYGPEAFPDLHAPKNRGFMVHAEISVELPVEHGLLLENLLDLAHAPFTHTNTFAKGWKVPSLVSFNTSDARNRDVGKWDPYPIEMAFHPPCFVISTIGFHGGSGGLEDVIRKGNHLHQMHACLPSKAGHTRLMYRMSLDFAQWARGLPFIDQFWKNLANQVLDEDLVLVEGQQKRLLNGGDTWNRPVSYDKLGVRYRRWRNALERSR